MSMPSFPPHGADMTREDAFTMIIASIAMEELALSHILNAEGEKLQYILGTLPGSNSCANPQEILSVNKSVTDLMEIVGQNQMLLKNKLSQVLEFCPRPCPPEPCPPHCPTGPDRQPGPYPPCCPTGPDCPFEPCPPPCPPQDDKSALQLTVQREKLVWSPDHRLPWRCRSTMGKNICWTERCPTQIQLCPQRAYMVHYSLNVCAQSPVNGTGAVLLKQSPCGECSEVPPLRFLLEPLSQGTQTLQYTAILYPCMCETGLSLVLDAPKALCVERAVLNVIELA